MLLRYKRKTFWRVGNGVVGYGRVNGSKKGGCQGKVVGTNAGGV